MLLRKKRKINKKNQQKKSIVEKSHVNYSKSDISEYNYISFVKNTQHYYAKN